MFNIMDFNFVTDTAGGITSGITGGISDTFKTVLEPVNKIVNSVTGFVSSINPNMLILIAGGVGLIYLLKK